MNINPFANVSLQDYLEIVQIVDSTFPIGSFNHSFGMENYLREATDNLEQVWHYDKVLTVSTQARETRQGTKMIAKQMLRLIQRLHAIPVLDDYQSKIRKGEVFGNPAIVFALYVFNKGLGCSEAIALYGYSVISTMVQNAVRAIPLGQFAGQEIVLRSFSQLEKMTQEIQELDASYLGANTPGLELAQMKHETQVFRLFMS